MIHALIHNPSKLHITALLASFTILACDPEGQPSPRDAELMDDEDFEALDELTDEEAEEAEEALEPVDQDAPDGLAVETPDPTLLSGTTKVCTVWVPNMWRDSIVMNQNSPWTVCNNYRAIVAGTQFAVGCMNDGGIWFGPSGGADPVPNCGW